MTRKVTNSPTTADSSIKDSGERRVFQTGAHRDRGTSKGAFHLLPFSGIEAVAKVFEAGAKKYTASNWRLGMPLSEYANSALRHSFKASQGWQDEPHPAMAAWNWLCFIETKSMIDAGQLPKELDDIQDWLSDDGVTKALESVRVANKKRLTEQAK